PETLRYENHLILAEGDYVICHGRFSGNGRPRSWVAADVVRRSGWRAYSPARRRRRFPRPMPSPVDQDDQQLALDHGSVPRSETMRLFEIATAGRYDLTLL